MDTDEHEPGLLRRIEELAAQAGDESPEAPVLAAALAGLRAEIGSLRADLTSLRADLTAVRTAVDASIGQLAGEVTATRSEAGGVASRHAELGERVDDLATVLDGVAAALPTSPGLNTAHHSAQRSRSFPRAPPGSRPPCGGSRRPCSPASTPLSATCAAP